MYMYEYYESMNLPDLHSVCMCASVHVGMARVVAMRAGGGELDDVRVLSEAGRDTAIALPISTNDRNHEKELNRMSVVTGTAFVQGGYDSSPNVGPGVGWGGAGGPALWFDPTVNVGFGYTVTVFVAGYNVSVDHQPTTITSVPREI